MTILLAIAVRLENRVISERKEQPSMIIDADAHVVETAHTWDYLDGSEKKYRPQLFQSADNPNAQYWFLDGKNIGFRNATLSEQELIALSKATGRTLQTAADARELRDVELRLQHMDALGIDVQILFNTMWIARVADKAEAEIALCGSWNRWMAEVWKQGKNRLRWSCVVPAMTISETSNKSASPETMARWPSVSGHLKMTGISSNPITI